MYRCNNCGEEFSEDYAKYFRFDEHCEMKDIDLDGEMMCPRCESMDYVKLQYCEVCDELTEDVLCDACKQKASEVADYARKRWSMDYEMLVDMLSLRAECHA